MANKRTVALTETEYRESIDLLRTGFELNGKIVKPNPRIATIVMLQATLGLRLGDVLALTVDSIIRDGNRYRLNIKEEKTGKMRTFTVANEVYAYILGYALENEIGKNERLFSITKRQVSRHLNKLFARMGLNSEIYGSHSFRKFFAVEVFENSANNPEVVRILLQHSSVVTTQRYLSISSKQIEDALTSATKNLI